MTNIFFKDAVTAANLDPNAKYAVYYADGLYANHWAVARQCPQAKLFGITVRGLTGPDIFACDCEAGDLTVAQAERWVAEQINLGVQLVCVYASLDTWLYQGLKDALAHYGHRIKRWVADFNDVAQIQPWADAEQYSDPGPVDLNVALDTFFGAVPPVVRWASAELQVSVPEGTTDLLYFNGTFNPASGQWLINGTPAPVHWSGPGGGQWRIQGIPFNSPPLGGN